MTTLNAMLAGARQRTEQRRNYHRERERRRSIDRGNTPRESQHETVEKVASALFARDFLNDLDRLLVARRAMLCLAWKGKRGQLYVRTGPDDAPVIEVLMNARRNDPRVLGCFEGEIGKRVFTLMQQHEISMCIGWVSGALLLQAGNQAVSTTYCLTMIRVSKEGQQGRYMNESEIGPKETSRG